MTLMCLESAPLNKYTFFFSKAWIHDVIRIVHMTPRSSSAWFIRVTLGELSTPWMSRCSNIERTQVRCANHSSLTPSTVPRWPPGDHARPIATRLYWCLLKDQCWQLYFLAAIGECSRTFERVWGILVATLVFEK